MASYSDLSTELRLWIYSYIPVPTPRNKCLWELKRPGRSCPAVLHVCKQMHREVLSVWGSAWPPTYRLYIPQTLRLETGYVSPFPHPEAPAIEKWCAEVGNVTKQVTRIHLIGAEIPLSEIPRRIMNRWRPIEADQAGEKIDHVVKHLVRYFKGLKNVEIELGSWPPMLWERGLVKLVDGINSIETVKVKLGMRGWYLKNGEMMLDQDIFDLAMYTGEFLIQRNKGYACSKSGDEKRSAFMLTDMASRQANDLTMKQYFDKITGDPRRFLTIGMDPLRATHQFSQDCSNCFIVPSLPDSNQAQICKGCSLTALLDREWRSNMFW